MQTVYLPSKFNTDTMYDFISKVLDSDSLPRNQEFTFNFYTLSFIRPEGITVLNNIIGRLKKHGCVVYFDTPPPDFFNKWCPIRFLDDSNFFKHYLGQPLSAFATLRNTTFPLEAVSYNMSLDYLDRSMNWLASKLHMTKSSLGDIETSLKEIFNNIDNHSTEQIGSTFLQHFPNEREVRFSISDFGIGIPTNVRKLKPSLTDGQALLQAIEEGFSTKTVPGNRGAGLDLLLHNVVLNNQGYVYIHSNHGILRCNYGGSKKMDITYEDTPGYYPGTLLDICFKTDTIENIEEEFSWDSY